MPLLGLLDVGGRSGSPGRRGGLYAAAAAVVWALEAIFIKAATETLTGDGILAMLTDWPVYAIVISGIVGTVLTQAAPAAHPPRADHHHHHQPAPRAWSGHELALRLQVKLRNLLTQLGEWARLGFFTRTGFGTYALNTPPSTTSSTTAPDS